MSELKADPRFHHPRCQQNTKTASLRFWAMFILRFCNAMVKFLHQFCTMFRGFKIFMHADTQLNRMSGDVPPPDGRRNRKSNGKAMFGLWRTDVWVMSGRYTWPCAFIHHRGNIQRMITRHKRTVWEETAIESVWETYGSHAERVKFLTCSISVCASLEWGEGNIDAIEEEMFLNVRDE